MNYKKILGLSLFSILLLTACNEERHPLEDYVVNKDDLKEEELFLEPTKTQEVKDIEAHNEKERKEALTEYQNSIEIIKHNEDAENLYTDDGELKQNNLAFQKLEYFDKWDAMMILDILNQYDVFFTEKTTLSKNIKEDGSFNNQDFYKNQDLNEMIYDTDEFFEELVSEDFVVYYDDLKKFHGLVKTMIHKEEENFDVDYFNTVKSQYEQRKMKFLRSVGLNKLVSSEHFRETHE